MSDIRGLTFVHGDIGDAGLLASLLPGHEVVVNFAAETHVDRSIAGARRLRGNQRAGRAGPAGRLPAAGVARVVQVSTDEVYGSVSQDPGPKARPWSRTRRTRRRKPAGHARPGLREPHGLDVRITRCCNNYGPYQFPEKVIPLFITNLLDGLRVPLYGDGRNIRHWVHVADHCRGIQLVLEHGSRRRCLSHRRRP